MWLVLLWNCFLSTWLPGCAAKWGGGMLWLPWVACPKCGKEGSRMKFLKVHNFIIDNQNWTVLFKELLACVPKILRFVSMKSFSLDRPIVHIMYSRPNVYNMPITFQLCIWTDTVSLSESPYTQYFIGKQLIDHCSKSAISSLPCASCPFFLCGRWNIVHVR